MQLKKDTHEKFIFQQLVTNFADFWENINAFMQRKKKNIH